MSTCREQALVNAQVDLNRAAFLMNAEPNKKLRPYSLMSAEEYDDGHILRHIDSAIKNLQEAREGYYHGQLSLFGGETRP
ncbi:MAG TPA: hypothetical protein PK600_09140 [Deltaproteobacteria bacterium]|nr:hypothetical protein [Deltaproteobacteria bacterium]